MHKFFCNYNNLTEQYELSINRNTLFPNKVSTQGENDMLEDVKNNIQILYEYIVELKNLLKDNENLSSLDETELLLSNLYYSLFSSPMDLKQTENDKSSAKEILAKAIEIASYLDKKINIPEYNRLARIITNNLQNILNGLN